MIMSIKSDTDIIRLCVIPSIAGQYSINSFIQFDLDGNIITQPIQNPKFEATEMKFYVQKKTGKKNVLSFGTAVLKSHIFLYDNDILVGQTETDDKGERLIEFELVKPSTYSKH